MRIGIDIDGVLTDIEQWQLDYGSKYFYETEKREIVNYKGYETTEIFGVGQEKDDAFWKLYYIEYSKNVKMRKFADEVIRKLKDDGHEIYIITARGSFLKDFPMMEEAENEQLVLDWLKENHIFYHKIIFSPEEKLEICVENKIDCMIEDKPANILTIATRIPVICFHANYNEQCEDENITRCYTWYDILAKLEKGEKA